MEQTSCERGREISDEEAALKHALFDKYVMPYTRMIYKLVMDYSFNPRNIRDNYYDVLTNMYKYIDSYNPEMSIHTWLHIVTKRCVFDLETKRVKMYKNNSEDDIETIFNDTPSDDDVSENVMGIDNYRELYNDDILYALDRLKPSYKRAFLLQQAGYKLKEIVDIEYANGTLKTKNIDTIKSRLFLARQTLKEVLTRDGERRKDS